MKIQTMEFNRATKKHPLVNCKFLIIHSQMNLKFTKQFDKIGFLFGGGGGVLNLKEKNNRRGLPSTSSSSMILS